MVEGAAGGLAARTETKPDGRRLTVYRLRGDDPDRQDGHGTDDAGTGVDLRP